MANQVALRVLTRPGDDVVVSRESHAVWHETGASAANAGVQFTEIGAAAFQRRRIRRGGEAARPSDYPPTTLVEIETPTIAPAGWSSTRAKSSAVRSRARTRHRIFSTARGFGMLRCEWRSLPTLAAPFDLVAVALSKGLGAPAARCSRARVR